jgi:hypothetical protein
MKQTLDIIKNMTVTTTGGKVWSASTMGKKGGSTTKLRYGVDHYKTIGKMGGRPKKTK